MANHTSSQQSPHSNWLVDSSASHHVTTDLNALSMPQDYAGSDDIVIGDGIGLEITHTGSTTLPTSSTPFTLSNVLCVPSMQNNLISVSKFCKTNKVFVEFFPAFFVVKDLRVRAPCLHGQNKNDVYEWPNTVGPAAPSPIANVSIKASFHDWHNRLGHPSCKVLASIINSHSLPLLSKQPSNFLCESCNCNKSHRLPFGTSTLSSSQPLELIYSDVWGPSPILSNDGFQYYVIFVDHFTKYTWLYPLRLKSDVLNVFTKFKTVVEKFFKTSILTIYSDGGGEYQKLKSFLETYGIQHLKTPPHTPQHNGSAERRHCHIVETGLTLLHNASLPLSFWSFAFQTTSYLINHLLTPLLNNKSPFESLFRSPPNYSKLRIFGYLCFPWLKPYTSHKLEPKSRLCLFLGYSSSQSAYKCYDLSSKIFFISHHVKFFEHVFPMHTNPIHSSWVPSSTIDTWSACSPSLAAIFPPHFNVPLTHMSSPPTLHVTSSPSPAASHGHSTSLDNMTSSSCDETSVPHVPSPQPQSSHPSPTTEPPIASRIHSMTTRSQNNIFKPKQLHLTTKHPLPDPIEPTTVSQAMKDPCWCFAMAAELNALVRNGT